MPAIELSLDEARRIALAAQGFDRPRPRGRVDVRHLRRAIRQMGLLQLDFVNVLEPSHYVVPFSRLGPYDKARLDDLVYRRREFTEAWAHEASIVPMEHWPHLAYRRATHRVRPWGFDSFLRKNRGYVEMVLAEVRRRGPLTAAEIPAPENAPRRVASDWYLTVPRCVLEAHFGFGRVGVASRAANFARAYDAIERVVRAEQLARDVPHDEGRRALLESAARACGVALAADLADYYRMPVREARPRLDELVEEGRLVPARVEGWRPAAYLHPDASDPGAVRGAALLSPFDPLVWCRPRTRRLFGFDYRFEIFVPAAKRRHGKYVLPFLLGERLVARVDLRADRPGRALRVEAAYVEDRASGDEVAGPLAAELSLLAGWLGLDGVRVGRRGGLARRLARAIGA